MKRLAWFVISASALLPSLARAGGFEILEQSPAGVAMSGAQSAAVRDPSAVFYNPAAMAHQRGLGVLGGVSAAHVITEAQSGTGANQATAKSIVTRPPLYGYLTQRIGARFAIGVGLFANFGLAQSWPERFPGRFVGIKFALTTVSINPALAIRPVPWLSLGFGLVLMPAAVELRRALNFGSTEGQVHTGMDAFGVGGNLALLIRVVPRYLDFAFTYRSAIELSFKGEAALTVPRELASRTAALQKASATLVLPHNFTFGLATRPARGLTLALDVHLTLWSSVDKLQLTLTDPNAPAGTMPTVSAQPLNFQDSVGVRFGLEYRVANEKMPLRLGGGWDKSPTPANTMSPLGPDADRGLFSFGLGYHAGIIGIDVSYLLIILPARASTLPDFPATYQTMGHVVTLGISGRLEDFGGRLNEPSFKH